MTKNIQTKILVIFFILGFLIIAGIGGFLGHIMNQASEEMIELVPEQTEQITTIFLQHSTQMNIVIGAGILFFLIVTAILGGYMAKVIIEPINRLVKNAKKIAQGEEVQIEPSTDKEYSEVDELVNAFNVMTKELKQNLTRVNQQKKQIETILENMTDGILAFDTEGNIIHMNVAAKELCHLSEEHTFEAIFEKLELDVNLEKMMYLDTLTALEQKINIEDRYLNILFVPFSDDDTKKVTGIIAVIQDITEHVRLDNMRKEFVADVSHELKTPITSIMGYAETLAGEEYDKDTQTKFLNVIITEAKRMTRLVTDLLTLSRYDNNRIKKEKMEFDLGELVKKCQEKLAIEIEKKQHKVECFVTANVPPVYADKYGIERVILNILMNSIKYTKEHGEIKIYVGFVYNDAYIKVIDNGIGIPEKDLERIFERFYRVDKARSRELGGSGLGLSIAKEILEKNQGEIDIKSESGKGTEVIIKIPTKKEEEKEN